MTNVVWCSFHLFMIHHVALYTFYMCIHVYNTRTSSVHCAEVVFGIIMGFGLRSCRAVSWWLRDRVDAGDTDGMFQTEPFADARGDRGK